MVKRAGLVLIFLGVVCILVTWHMGTQHWLADHTGTDYCASGLTPEQLLTCRAYNAWSGFISDLGEYVLATSLLGSLGVAWRVHTCHRYWWCWRPPLHQLEGTPYKLCHVHHPDDVQTVAEAVAAREA